MAADIDGWLGELGLERYADVFRRNEIDLAALPYISDDDLKEIGIALGARRRLIAAIAALGTATAARAARYADDAGAPAADTPRSYTPNHLAERILSARNQIQGERKHVTVLFADIKDSTKLIEQFDPEEAANKLRPAIAGMMSAVHEFEGTVNKVQGDGIMALFGAPLAHEDHAQRACLAALSMREAVSQLADPDIALRIGLHSGDVLVRAINNDLSMDYEAIGATVHLASRMEQLARPGAICMTPATNSLAAGFVETRSLGATAIKGISRDVEVFELVRKAALATRWDARSVRELTDFTGRERELGALKASAGMVRSRRGELVALVGEAGMGKSRLVHELLRTPEVESFRILQTGTSPYGVNTPFMPIGTLLRSLFDIGEDDGKSTADAKVVEALSADRSESDGLLSAARFLLDLPVEDAAWTALDPLLRRDRIVEELRTFLTRIARDKPLLLVFEDLHWTDSETQRLLDALAASLGGHRILMLVTYRPEYRHGWADKSYYSRIRVDPLEDGKVRAMLDELIGPAPELTPLKRVLSERTEGRPLFVEELVRALIDSGVLTVVDGEITLSGSIDHIDLPGSVQDVLASRIDRLEPGLKRLLQTASVIGRRVRVALLKSVSHLLAAEVDEQLARLQDLEFVYEVGDRAQSEFLFKHALTEEVAYASLVNEVRRDLHARLVDAYAAEFAGRLEEYSEEIARHAIAAERWREAYKYGQMAARKAHARSAYQTAVEWFDQAAAALERLPDSDTRLADMMDIRLEMRIALWPLGQHETLARRVLEAGALAEKAGDTRRMAIVHNYMTAHYWQEGEHEKAIQSGERGIALAEQAGDFSVRVTTMQHLGLALLARGDYARQTGLHREVAEALTGASARERHGMAGYPGALVRGFLAFGLCELGDFDEASRWSREGLEIAREVDSAMTTVWVTNSLALNQLMQGSPAAAIDFMRENFEICRKSEVRLLYAQTGGILGHVLAAAGDLDDAIPFLQQAVDPENLAHHTEGLGYPIVWYAMALRQAGRPDDALAVVHRALDVATRQGERGHEAWALYAKAGILADRGADASEAGRCYAAALRIADLAGMRPLAALCRSAAPSA